MERQSRRKPPTVTQFVTDELRARILRGELAPGADVDENELARDLDVSRTPVRYAVRHLAHDGLVELVPRRGARVKRFDLRDALNTMEVRTALEALAFRKVAPHIADEDLVRLRELHHAVRDACDEGDYKTVVEADLAFHDYVVQRSGNDQLIDFAGKLSIVMAAAFWIGGHNKNASAFSRQRDDHLPLLNALASRDGEAAEAAIRAHIDDSEQYILRLMAEDQARGASAEEVALAIG